MEHPTRLCWRLGLGLGLGLGVGVKVTGLCEGLGLGLGLGLGVRVRAPRAGPTTALSGRSYSTMDTDRLGLGMRVRG